VIGAKERLRVRRPCENRLQTLLLGMEEEITFTVGTCPETGGFVARWDDPRGGGITTQGETLGELQAMITDAVSGYFDPSEAPARIKIHFEEDPVLLVA
jgi:predicted RNase H-like HicB family nuclease